MTSTLGIFIKRPLAGRVKTRLAEKIGIERATALYAAFLGDTVDRFREVADRRTLCFTPPDRETKEYVVSLAGDDFESWSQPTGDLGRRLSGFFTEHLAGGAGRVIAIGSDSPTLPRAFIEEGFRLLENRDCVICPAMDGGYCLIGLRDAELPLFDSVDWSSRHVLAQTISRLRECGASLAMLSPWYDIDTEKDLEFLRGHVQALRDSGETVDLPRTVPLLDVG